MKKSIENVIHDVCDHILTCGILCYEELGEFRIL